VTDEFAYEIAQRLREIHGLLIQREGTMIIQNLKQRVGSFFDHLAANHPGSTATAVIAAMRKLVLLELDMISEKLSGLFAGGTYADAVNFLRKFAKGNLSPFLPWYVRWFANPDKYVDQICDWLLANQQQVGGTIGALPPG
jgi:hypothetical protein